MRSMVGGDVRHARTPCSRHPRHAPRASNPCPAAFACGTEPGRALRRAPPDNGLGFGLFLLVNAVLFVRPADVVPALMGIEIYQYLILLCLAVSFPGVLAQLSPSNLEARPIDVCVLFMLPAIVMSHLSHANVGAALECAIPVLKVLVYYFLFVSLVTTPERLRLFISCQILFSTAVAGLSALDYHGVIELPLTEELKKLVEELMKNGDEKRMYGPGIFQDPNDICVLIVTAVILLMGKLGDRRVGLRGVAGPAGRPGILLLPDEVARRAAGAAGWVWHAVPTALRLGQLLLGGLGAPVLLAVLGGRQTAISTTTNTGQERIQLWNEGMVMFRANPLFGVGMDRYHEEAVQVAHNSYMQSFAELGLFGGSLFLGAFFLAVMGLYRLVRPVADLEQGTASAANRPVEPLILDDTLRQLHPYLTSALTAYCAA